MYISVTDGFNQVWRTQKKIKTLFLIREIKADASAIGSIADIYYSLFPDDEIKGLVDLDIKQEYLEKRDLFQKHLWAQYKINGWFSSIEGNNELEVCLWDKQNIMASIEFVESYTNYKEKNFTDALEGLIIKPGISFLQKSIKNMTNSSFEKYKVYNSNMIAEEIRMGGNDVFARLFFFNLRMKLKI